jgi:hypothetical protein
MWTLSLPGVAQANEQLTTALIRADGQLVYALSAAERAAVLAVYTAYDALLGRPDGTLLPAVLDQCRPYIRDAYGQVQIGGRLASLRASLLASVDTCPYCGFGEPNQLDHYLPRMTYGELAIYPRNLIPSCGPCNNAKRTVLPGIGPGAGFIHAYLQDLPNSTFLRANISFVDSVLEVTFQIDDAHVPEQLAEMLDYQLVRLKLNERYPRQINKFLSEQRTAILMFREMGLELGSFFARSAASLAASFGRNDWRVALLDGLASHEEFCADPGLYLGMRVVQVAEGQVVLA